MKKWSEFYIINWLEKYYSELPMIRKISKIECVLSELEKYVLISPFDGSRYYPDNDVKKELGLMHNDLEKAYSNQGYGELVAI